MYRHILVVSIVIVQIIGWSCATDKSPPKSPIIAYKETNNGKVEHVSAVIKPSNLDQGTGVSTNARNQLKSYRYTGDDAGHLIGNRLGGTGKKNYNLIPQNLGVNRGAYRLMEDEIYKEVKRTGQPVTMDVRPRYDSNLQRRPSSVDVSAVRQDGTVLTQNSFPNHKYTKPVKSGLSKSTPNLSQIGGSSSNTQSAGPSRASSNPNVSQVGRSSGTQIKRQRSQSSAPGSSSRGRGRGRSG